MASATALAIGGSFLSAFLQVLFDRMASREVVGFFRDRKLNDRLLKKLKVLMISVNGVLDDAEEKQIAKPAVEMWVNELKDAVYEADDLLDEIAYEALRSEHFILIMNGQLGRQSVYSLDQHILISHIAGELEFWVPQHSLASHFAQLLREKSFMCRLASFRTCPRGIEEANGLCKFNFIPCLMMMFKMVQGSRLWKP
ncbi:hypothetical protein NC653_012617 [Populus alba x Populus x berolinensis]|uniref:Disease resistance N-terminal domain-containing protein n=1 Tax=Populus alba x Populus x berolinensis TaxID=444605 RepID=A0AAD6QSC7_9ROSI|nr:hypothetical protein NC653_012617 [Populus alba x Populus x berolinensis]